MKKDQLYAIAGVKNHTQLERWLREAIRDPDERAKLYGAAENLHEDTFREYFEEYAAERKSNKQDYTPNAVATLLSDLIADTAPDVLYDGAAGTGALLIAHWHAHPQEGRTYVATEYGDNVIPYLVHNLAMRNMEAVVIHGDTLERACVDVYVITNGTINILPHTNKVAQEYGVAQWTEDTEPYFESEEVREEYEEA